MLAARVRAAFLSFLKIAKQQFLSHGTHSNTDTDTAAGGSYTAMEALDDRGVQSAALHLRLLKIKYCTHPYLQ